MSSVLKRFSGTIQEMDSHRLRRRHIQARGGIGRMESKCPEVSDRISKNGSTAVVMVFAESLGGPCSLGGSSAEPARVSQRPPLAS